MKVFLNIVEVGMMCGLSLSLPFTLMGVTYHILFSPIFGIISCILIGLLGADLILRAVEGKGISG